MSNQQKKVEIKKEAEKLCHSIFANISCYKNVQKILNKEHYKIFDQDASSEYSIEELEEIREDKFFRAEAYKKCIPFVKEFDKVAIYHQKIALCEKFIEYIDLVIAEKEEIAKREEEEVATEKATSQTLKTIRYEWIYLDVDCNGDIQNLDATENFCKAVNESIEINDDWASKTVCLQKTYLDTFGYATDETRSYYDSGYLQTTFEDGSKVPTRYIKEVDKWFRRNS